MEIENLKALIEGIKLNAYQKALAVKEFEHLLASNGYEYQALSMSGVSDLLPCPFCGSEAQTVKLDYTYSTMCSNSECDVCPEVEAQTRQESIVNWNKRQ